MPPAARVPDADLAPVVERLVDVGAVVGRRIVEHIARRGRVVGDHVLAAELHVELADDLVDQAVLVRRARPDAVAGALEAGLDGVVGPVPEHPPVLEHVRVTEAVRSRWQLHIHSERAPLEVLRLRACGLLT